MIRIDINGTDGAAACGRVVTSNKAPICVLARQLIADGYAEHDITDVYRGHMRVFRSVPLSWWAERTVREGEAPIKMVRYVAMPTALHAETQP